MPPVGSVRGTAEPALLATKSEVFSPVVFAGGVVAAAAPLAVVGTVTVRVSVLPVVGTFNRFRCCRGRYGAVG